LSGGRADWLETQPHTEALRDAVVRLRVSHRFGARSGIGALARATQEGDADAALAVLLDDAHPDVALDGMSAARGTSTGTATGTSTGTSTGAHAAQLLGPLVPFIEQYLAMEQPGDALAALARFRLLCALREGDMGVVGLNALVEQWLTAQGRDATGGYNHRPVLITANDVGMQLFNGDVGMTLAVDGVPMVHFPLPDGGVRSLPPARLPAHETAWAMTVHKSQGSEFDHVRFVLPATDNRLLTRELVYTGVTRAKASVSLVGTADIVRAAIQRSVARASGLVQQLT
jgi:exodeoxyribonuclease V alpha subunit